MYLKYHKSWQGNSFFSLPTLIKGSPRLLGDFYYCEVKEDKIIHAIAFLSISQAPIEEVEMKEYQLLGF